MFHIRWSSICFIGGNHIILVWTYLYWHCEILSLYYQEHALLHYIEDDSEPRSSRWKGKETWVGTTPDTETVGGEMGHREPSPSPSLPLLLRCSTVCPNHPDSCWNVSSCRVYLTMTGTSYERLQNLSSHLVVRSFLFPTRSSQCHVHGV